MIRRTMLRVLSGSVLATYPGLGGQQRPPQNASPAGQLVPGVQPGITGQIVARRVVIIGANGELLVYSPTQGAGNLVESISGAAQVDPFGNNVLAGNASYAAGFATALNAGFVAFYTGSLAGGWTPVSEVAGDVSGNLQVNAGGALQLVGSSSVAITGTTVTINGSSNTGSGNNGGVTSGPSGTVSSFPAAGPNHTHSEVHQHPL